MQTPEYNFYPTNEPLNWDDVSSINKPANNATVGATAGTNLKKSDDTVLADADVVTSLGTAAAIASQGALATKSAVDLATAEVTNKSADNIAESATKKWAGETGADVTSAHEAATIASQGALATANAADFSTQVSGAEKPANNATVGATAGTNLQDSGATILNDTDIKNIYTLTAGMAITAGQAVYMSPTTAKIYPTNSTAAEMDWQALNFIGFALANIAKDATGKVKVIGTIEGLTGLAAGSVYYLKDASGTIDYNITTTDSTVALGTSEAQYQSFTTGASTTNIYRMTLYFGANTGGTITVNVREGTGIGGTLVGTFTATTPNGASSLNLYSTDYIILSPNTVYSVCPYSNVGGITLEQDTANPYAGGRNDQNANYDYKMQIYSYTASTLGLIDTSAGTVSKKIGIALSSTVLQILNS